MSWFVALLICIFQDMTWTNFTSILDLKNILIVDRIYDMIVILSYCTVQQPLNMTQVSTLFIMVLWCYLQSGEQSWQKLINDEHRTQRGVKYTRTNHKTNLRILTFSVLTKRGKVLQFMTPFLFNGLEYWTASFQPCWYLQIITDLQQNQYLGRLRRTQKQTAHQPSGEESKSPSVLCLLSATCLSISICTPRTSCSENTWN